MRDQFNFIVVGSGAAGLVGAITAAKAGLRPVIIEKSDVWGGTTALSGGVLWVPDNHLMRAEGDHDSIEARRAYVLGLLGDAPSERQISKAEAYLESCTAMAEFLAAEGIRWKRNRDHPDYYPGAPGAFHGRTLESEMFDGTRLGERFKSMRTAELDLPAIDSEGLGTLTRAWRSPRLLLNATRVAVGHKFRRLRGQKPLGLGRGLVASLMQIVDRLGIEVRLSTRLVNVVIEHQAAVGVVVECDGREERLDAPAGVLLAAGGFAQNARLRKELQGFDRTWSNAPAEDQGDALLAALSVGAETELTDDCWWMPSIEIGPGALGLALGLRALPGSIVVNGAGNRYMNEACSYMTSGRLLRENGAADERHWLVMDDRFLRRYIFAELSQKSIRKTMLENGTLHRADTIEELAARCGVDSQGLARQVERFNGYARTGFDLEYQRGETSYDRYWADPDHKPNPSLGEISKPPYWAALIRPGDLGTNGGIRTDQYGRALRAGDQPIEGLYAAGNGSGSPFGRSYPGAGATIGSAATFGFIAARFAARRRVNDGN